MTSTSQLWPADQLVLELQRAFNFQFNVCSASPYGVLTKNKHAESTLPQLCRASSFSCQLKQAASSDGKLGCLLRAHIMDARARLEGGLYMWRESSDKKTMARPS
jgi:hypothetical protein